MSKRTLVISIVAVVLVLLAVGAGIILAQRATTVAPLTTRVDTTAIG